jgi:hypothetical protein
MALRNAGAGLRDALETVIRSRAVAFLLALVAVGLGVVALLKSPVAAAIVIAALVISFTAVGIYGLLLRDRFGGLWEIIADTDEWDIRDASGNLVLLTKSRKLRFLQNGVFAIRDYAWGDGQYEDGYSCDPGVAVDNFRQEGRHNVVVSLRETKRRGDVGDFQIQRTFIDSFRNQSESVHADILTMTQQLTIKVMFPADRPPTRAWAISHSAKAAQKQPHTLSPKGAADGRQYVEHTLRRPKFGEEYIVGWDW